MRNAFVAVLIIGLISLLLAPRPIHGDDARPASNNAAASTSSNIEDRGAGYLPYSEPTPFGSGGFFGTVLRTIFSLAVVLGLLYATLWLIKRVTGTSTVPSSGGALRVVGRFYLSPKAIIYFVRLVDELLVIGTNANNISLLTTIRDKQQIVQIEDALKSAQGQVSGLPFSRFFDKSLNRFQRTLAKEDSNFDEQLRVLDDQIGRLKGLARRKQSDEE